MHMFVRVREMIAGHADLLRHLDVLEHPSVQCRASHSLYFIVKDHPFVDRNKRIGTLLFLDWPRAAS
jgi:prophage maintenance system killer protein